MKRKIFYFLKTKEEYDYMLTNNQIPKRGVVFIQSTQEIYRDKVPYSGYSPLKQYFDSLKAEVLSLIQDNNKNISSMVELMDLKLQEDFNDYLDKSRVKLSKVTDLLNQVKTALNNSEYYINNTLVPSLENTRKDIQTLSNKHVEITTELDTKMGLVDSFKSTLETLSGGLSDLGSRTDSDVSNIYNYIKSEVVSLIDNKTTYYNEQLKAWVKSYTSSQQISDTVLRKRVLQYVDLNSFEDKINNKILNSENNLKTYVDTKILEAQIPSLSSGSSNTTTVAVPATDSSITNYATITYVDTKLRQLESPASSATLGLVRVGDYLKIESDGRLSVDRNSLRIPEVEVSLADLDRINSSIAALQELNSSEIERVTKQILDNYVDILLKIKLGKVAWSSIFSDDSWKSALNSQLQTLGLMERKLDGTVVSIKEGIDARIDSLDDKIKNINIFVDEEGNAIGYNAFKLNIINALKEDTSISQMYEIYQVLDGKEEALDYILTNINNLSSKGTTLSEAILSIDEDLQTTKGNLQDVSNNLHTFIYYTLGTYDINPEVTLENRILEVLGNLYETNSNPYSIKASIAASILNTEGVLDIITTRLTSANLTAAALLNASVKINPEGINVVNGATTLFNISSTGAGRMALDNILWEADGHGRIGKNNEISWNDAGEVSIKSSAIEVSDSWTIKSGVSLNTYEGKTYFNITLNNESNPINITMDNRNGFSYKIFSTIGLNVLSQGLILGRNDIGIPGIYVLSSDWDGMWHKGYTGKHNGMIFINGICVGVE